MLRFGAALAAVLFLAMAITARSPGMLAFAIFGVVACATVSVFAFAGARIDSSSRDHVYVPTPEEAELMKKRALRQREAFERKQAQARGEAPKPVAAEYGDGGED